MIAWRAVSAAIADATQADFELADAQPLSGGSINQAWRMTATDGRSYFAKLNRADTLPMFAAEQTGLAAVAATATVRVPHAITCGVAAERAFLVLEYLALNSRGNALLLGRQLAALHRTQAPQFGWQQDNTLGTTPQHNARSSDWVAFWSEQRLGFQLDLAARNGYRGELQKQGRELQQKLPQLFADYRPVPSLLHGDLWGGNRAYCEDGTPVLFDPAPYFGDREADLAMTELFGGFDAQFYTAYHAAWPLDPGYVQRKTLYNLYHILNHANLFGGGYLRQAEAMMQRLNLAAGNR
ncbi:MAG: fructosamine kinase family protein [Pseudomonadota bacterium]